MEPRARETGSDSYAVKVCPKCGAKGSMLYQKVAGKQGTLDGRETDVWSKRERPVCSKCGVSFGRDEELPVARLRL